jgi:peptidoglycan/xylan/chitin deacetylase (PgdA/CDA1 family)
MRAILTYHSIDTSGSPISVSPAAFRRQVEHLVQAGVAFVTIDELLGGRAPGHSAVAVTFDDGFANIAADALPLLVERGLPATIFVVSECVGATNRWATTDGYGLAEQPLLDWEALGRLTTQGLTIGSHSRTHPDLTRVSPAQVEDEIHGAASEIARRLGHSPAGFAYPYGAADAHVRAAIAGVHRWACTTEFRAHDDSRPFALPRLDMWYFEEPGLFERWGTPAFARWVRRRRRLRQARAMWRRMAGA